MPELIADYPAYRAREKMHADAIAPSVAEPGPEVRERLRVTIPVEGGVIEALVYQPFGEGPHPVHMFLHGGGWVLGSIDHAFVDIACRERCAGAGMVVVAVNYRKAPEHKFPVPLNDCYAALQWIAAHIGELGGRLDRICVGGQSAGANLGAALALKVRDQGGPRIALQLLEVAALDLTLSMPSHALYGSGYALARTDVLHLRGAYLGSLGQAGEAYASPLLAPSLAGLPPAHVMSAEYDVVRDDGEAYARRLQDAGVAATYSLQRGHVHISGALTAVMASARAWRAEVLEVLRRLQN